MTVLGTQVALHKMGQTAAQHHMRKSCEAACCFMVQPVLCQWKSAEAAKIRLFHAVVTSTALWELEVVPLAQASSRRLDVSMTSMLCIMLL